MRTTGGDCMSVRMVCVKAPRALSGLLRLLAGQKKAQ